MARTTQTTEAPKWEQMLKQLATTTGPPSEPTVTAPSPQEPQSRHPPSGPRSSLSQDLPASKEESESKRPSPVSQEPLRPTPSPISDDGKAGGKVDTAAAPDQEKPAAEPSQPDAKVHGAETWRYSS